MTQPISSSSGRVHAVHYYPSTVEQFSAGAGGDRIDLSDVFEFRPAAEDGLNPFAEGGSLKLVQRGADTVLQWRINQDFSDVLVLRNVVAGSLVAANFVGGISPDGAPGIGIACEGTDGADRLPGTQYADTITGFDGDDNVRGNGGSDMVDAGGGNDRVFGGSGNDTLLGGGGNDMLAAGRETYDVYDDFADSLEGGDGNDTLSSTGSRDTLDGGSGDDTLQVWGNAGVIRGGAGNDTFRVHTIAGVVTRLEGEQGRDTYVCGVSSYHSGALVEISGFEAGADGDVIDIVASLPSSMDDENPFGNAGLARLVQQGSDTVVQFDIDGAGTRYGMTTVFLLKNVDAASITAENLGGIAPDGSPVHIVRHGGDGDDSLSGSHFKTDLYGGGGDDTLSAGMGDARLYGEAGNDVMYGSSANVLMDGGEGNDTLNSAWYGSITMLGGAGNDVLSVGDDVTAADGGSGDDTLTIHERLTYSWQKEMTVTGGAGRDTFIPGWNPNGTLPVLIADFEAGNDGDRIDLGMLLTSQYFPHGALGANPFATAANMLRLVQDGADTLLQVGKTQWSSINWETLLVLKGVAAVGITAANFAGGISPDGSPVPGIVLNGAEANDTLEGTFFGDTLNGLSGDDDLRGNAGTDRLEGGEGNDVLQGGGGADTLLGGTGDDELFDYLANNDGEQSIDGGDGDDRIDFATGRAIVRGGNGDDTFLVRMQDGAAVTMSGGAGRDTFQFIGEVPSMAGIRIDDFAAGHDGDVIDLLKMLEQILGKYYTNYTGDNPFESGTLRLLQQGADVVLQCRLYQSYATVLTLAGVSLADLVDGNVGGLPIDGAPMPGNLVEADGANTYYSGGMFADTIVGSAAGEYMYGKAGSDSLLGGGGDDRLEGELGNDHLDGGAGKDRLDGGAGNDTLVGAAGDTLLGGEGDDRYVLLERGALVDTYRDDGQDTVEVRFDGAFTLEEGLNHLAAGAAGAVQFIGNSGSNSITGAAGDDSLAGGAGNDTLDGGAGNDTLAGGAGEDVYIIDSRSDIVVETEGFYNSIVTSLDSFTLTAHFNSLRYTGTGNFQGKGAASHDHLYGGAGADTLAGFGGSDELLGGAGDDLLSGHDGDDMLRGEAGNDAVSGGEGRDILTGGDGDDTLDGGIDYDYMTGGNGNDLYFVDDLVDRIIEDAGGGVDEIRIALSRDTAYYMAAHVENATVTSSRATRLYANEMANLLKGAGGNDELYGLNGDDMLDGGAGADLLQGGQGADTLVGGNGSDTLDGGDGEDLAVLDGKRGDYVFTRNGSDLVLASGKHVTVLRNVENVQFADGMLSVPTLLANFPTASADTLVGTSGNDTIDGLAGADRMSGGLGDDTYIAENAGDFVIECAGEGRDMVHVALAGGSYTLAANVEDARITSGGAIGLAGNDLDNALAGNAAANALSGGAGNDTLDGGKGSDKLAGGTGDDTYLVDATGDKVTELAGQGIDTVVTSLARYTLGANVENVTYTGSAAFAGTGNALDNVIAGGSGNDTIDGAGGSDTYVAAGAFADYARQRPNATDLVLVKGTQKITLKNIEQVQFSDGTRSLAGLYENVASLGNDTLTGTDGNEQMNGLAGADRLSGGKGDDTYFVDNVGDTVVELAGEGTDTVNIAIATRFTYTLGADIENATVTSTAAVNVIGNAEDNTLTGNAAGNALTGGDGNDILIGGKGNDTLDGGAGDDVYSVDAAGDKVIEAQDGGYDIVETTLAKYTLAANVEELRFTGKGAFAGTGNVLDNVIVGGAGNDKLTGGAGADTFVIGAGNDTITDFASSVDRLIISRTIGNGDDAIDGAVTLAGTGGFSSNAELVIFTQKVASLTVANAAKAIGSATEAYAKGDTALFALHDAKSTALYLFTSSGSDAVVGAGELVQVATLTGVQAASAADFALA
jgi:Ca2+-binding RTX toxin-like protein